MSSSSTLNYHPDGTLFIVSGPSAAGKTTLINRARAELQALQINLHFSVSHTTRTPRNGEVEGVNYHYVDRVHFEEMVAKGEFIEWARVHKQMYGTSKTEVFTRLERGEDVVLDIDVQGARQISEQPELRRHSVSIFVFPPSFDELEKRLRGRGLNTEDDISVRLRKASDEIDLCDFYDYVIINDDIKIATACLKAAIVARKLKTNSALLAIRDMSRRFKEEHSDRIAREC
ncbi:MAG: guanylate kinase [Thermoanaerobaculia bacterium]